MTTNDACVFQGLKRRVYENLCTVVVTGATVLIARRNGAVSVAWNAYDPPALKVAAGLNRAVIVLITEWLWRSIGV